MARTSDILRFILSSTKIESDSHVLCLSEYVRHTHYLAINGAYLGLMSLIVVMDVAFNTVFWKYKIIVVLLSWLLYILAVRSSSKYYQDVLDNSRAFVNNNKSTIIKENPSLPDVMSSVLLLNVASDTMALTTLTGKISSLHSRAVKTMTLIYAMFIMHAVAVIIMLNLGGN